jgi:hypothetical protein
MDLRRSVPVVRPSKFDGFAGVGAKQRLPLLRPYWKAATHQNYSDGVLAIITALFGDEGVDGSEDLADAEGLRQCRNPRELAADQIYVEGADD